MTGVALAVGDGVRVTVALAVAALVDVGELVRVGVEVCCAKVQVRVGVGVNDRVNVRDGVAVRVTVACPRVAVRLKDAVGVDVRAGVCERV